MGWRQVICAAARVRLFTSHESIAHDKRSKTTSNIQQKKTVRHFKLLSIIFICCNSSGSMTNNNKHK